MHLLVQLSANVIGSQSVRKQMIGKYMPVWIWCLSFYISVKSASALFDFVTLRLSYDMGKVTGVVRKGEIKDSLCAVVKQSGR